MTERRFGGFWRRLLAFLLDSLMLALPVMYVTNVLYGTGDIEQVPVVYLPFIFLASLYFIVMPVTKVQGTLGKRILGLKITNRNFQRITFKQSIGRYFAEILSGITMYIGYLLAAFMPQKTALHDILAKTYVVRIEKDT
ncbi:putative RDD family membrane protein YckC [Salsuginibacillus halophilus]|uniref:Putative RDD family membrane protein YckC n=1 Tax=Salsuginibacillus halophilus TaxID=517424 RepID=A0A2P8H9U8_9BACI|nr:RDD family protein [Salsuginibacillus halophilus]PSL42971.1 putative RDD family membrane protein YckC [Salsuginibacillus halophilus]